MDEGTFLYFLNGYRFTRELELAYQFPEEKFAKSTHGILASMYPSKNLKIRKITITILFTDLG